MRHKWFAGCSLLAMLLLTACNLPLEKAPTPTPTAIPPTNAPTPSAFPNAPPAASPTPPPAITHIAFPATAPARFVNRSYDVDSLGTAEQKYAPYGERYDLNLFERPFTQDMAYLPDLDIHAFSLRYDETWFYITIELNAPYNNSPVTYALELDTDTDGFGDFIILFSAPRSQDWETSGVRVFADQNHDTAGLSPAQSDAPFSGDGYETLIFEEGIGTDPDLAWARLSPDDPRHIEVAFKRTLAGNRFMFGVSADAGWQDPGRYDYSDRLTEAQAGSPLKNNPYYPLKELFAYDNTCRQAFGFEPSGLEARICPTEPPPPTATAQQCVNPGQYTDKQSCEAAGCKWIIGSSNVAMTFVCTYP